MTPTLSEGEIVVSWKGSDFHRGDIIAFYYNNKILVKRVIAGPGQWVDIREDGTVYVDGDQLDEPYLTEKAMGDCDIRLPYQVPDGRYFGLFFTSLHFCGQPPFCGGVRSGRTDRREDCFSNLAHE